MKKQLSYSIEIAAPRRHVWETMLHPDSYRAWTDPAWPGSYYEGQWGPGEVMRFLSTSGGGGMKATITDWRLHELLRAVHTAVIGPDGSDDTESDVARSLVGTEEAYSFADAPGGTLLTVHIAALPEWEEMFDSWAVALPALKNLCENR